MIEDLNTLPDKTKKYPVKVRKEIFKQHKLGTSLEVLSQVYELPIHTIENIIEFHRTPPSLRGVYWKGSPNEEYALKAKECYERLSRRAL